MPVVSTSLEYDVIFMKCFVGARVSNDGVDDRICTSTRALQTHLTSM